METLKIADYALLADSNSAALVGVDGSVDWLCFPRYDSPSIFARILDRDAGHWSIRPASPSRATRRYLRGSLILETTFETSGGTVRLLDGLAFELGQRGHALGLSPPHELLRLVEGTRGRVELELEFAPRPEYGLGRPLLRQQDGRVVARGGSDRLCLSAGVPVRIEDDAARASFAVEAGDSVGFALRWAPPEAAEPSATSADDVAAALDDGVEAWRSWEAEHDIYEGTHRDLVRFSSRVLKG